MTASRRSTQHFATIIASAILSTVAVAEVFEIPQANATALADAIIAANTNTEDDTINLAPNSTYILDTLHDTNATCPEINHDALLPPITTDITINGNGSTLTRFQGQPPVVGRFFNVCEDGDLTINNTTLTKGETNGSGGAILNQGGWLVLNECTLHNNDAFGNYGGAVAIFDGVAGFYRCTLSENEAPRFGGAMAAVDGSVVVERCTLTENHATDHGGAIAGESSSILVDTSTISRNDTNSYGSIFAAGGDVRVEYTTIALNRGGALGNATAIGGETPSMSARYSIIRELSHFDCDADYPISISYSIVGDSSCNLGTAAVIADPQIGPLRDNGGPTMTHALFPGSPAINKGTPFGEPDQRGFPRPSAARTDYGAYELTFGPGDADGSQVVDLLDFEQFLSCYTGPDDFKKNPLSICNVLDIVDDDRIDKKDFQQFQILYTDK